MAEYPRLEVNMAERTRSALREYADSTGKNITDSVGDLVQVGWAVVQAAREGNEIAFLPQGCHVEGKKYTTMRFLP